MGCADLYKWLEQFKCSEHQVDDDLCFGRLTEISALELETHVNMLVKED